MTLKIMMTTQKQTLRRKLMHLEHIGAKDISKSQLLFSKCFSFSKITIKKNQKKIMMTLKMMMSTQKKTLRRKLIHFEHIGAKDFSKSQFYLFFKFSIFNFFFSIFLWRWWWLLKNKCVEKKSDATWNIGANNILKLQYIIILSLYR